MNPSLPLQDSEDHEAALLEKSALLNELRSENLSKNMENQKLRRNIKKVTQELDDVRQERERLERNLEAALGEKSRGDGTIHVSTAVSGRAGNSACFWCEGGGTWGHREILTPHLVNRK